MAKAKKVAVTDIDSLNEALVREFGFQLEHPPVDEEGCRLPIPAAALAVITKYILSSGIRPTADSPIALRIADMYRNLPFTEDGSANPAHKAN
jgi:hypothetical protein